MCACSCKCTRDRWPAKENFITCTCIRECSSSCSIRGSCVAVHHPQTALWLERVIVSQMATVYTPPISTRDVTLITTAILINDLGCSVYACMLSYEVSAFLVSGLAQLCASSVGSTPHWDRPQTSCKRRCLQVCVWNAF